MKRREKEETSHHRDADVHSSFFSTVWGKDQDSFFAYGYFIIWALFVEKIIFSSFHCIGICQS